MIPMFNNYYKITIKGKDVKRFLKSLYKKGISFINIVIFDNDVTCKVDLNNYKKIMNVKTSYQIEVKKIYGFIYLKKLIKCNLFFIIFLNIGFFYLFFLSHIIFKINIIHDDKNIVSIINNELNNLNIKKYSFIKSYDYIKKAKDTIINNNKDKIEWIEIEKNGCSYNVRLEKRVVNKEQTKYPVRHLIAKRSGIIKKIEAHDGEIVKKINDYVKKGDIIISGEIHKSEDIKDNVSATGEVYAEVWYKVKVSIPFNYYEEKYTGRSLNTFKILFLSNEYNLFNRDFENKKTINNVLFSDFYNMFSINCSKDKEIIILDEINTLANENDAIILARDKIINQLDSNEYIISQKKLKTTINNSTINVEVFFKVYKNISSYVYYEIKEGL